jgi:uncharacterized membrane protein YqiK
MLSIHIYLVIKYILTVYFLIVLNIYSTYVCYKKIKNNNIFIKEKEKEREKEREKETNIYLV